MSEFPTLNTRKQLRYRIFSQTFSFRGTAQRPVRLISFDFYPWGDLNIVVCSVPIQNKETLQQPIFYARQTIGNGPWT